MFLTNAHLAELLAQAAQGAKGNAEKAFRRASRRAFIWDVEAAELLASGGILTELPGVGPFLAAELRAWIESSAAIPEPEPTRKGFLTKTECDRILARDPGWKARLKGDLQMHTDFSDGHASLREMAEAASQMRHQYIAITDHSKGLKIAGGIDEEELARQSDQIAELNDRSGANGLRVLASIELNINPDGEGDMDPFALRKLDIVLGSFHSQLRKSEDQTDRYLAAIRNPDLHILGHPRGRIYNFRLGLHAEWERVFAEAAALDKAVEIDCFPDRQDLDVDLLRVAASSGVRVSIGTDSHYPDQLCFIDFGLAATLEAGIPPARVINFMTANEIKDWVSGLRDA
ncbi:MAG TPA: PHP domain-containing protein [Actinomycetota bacterium]|nr:PHP domain-containing protein [Actinomycetota bacterium]